MLGHDSDGCLSFNAFVIVSRSRTFLASLVTLLVFSGGISLFLIMASSAICLSAIVLRTISISANHARFQMGTNAVRYASSSVWYAFSRTSSSGKCTWSSNLSKASWTSLMNCCVWFGFLAHGVTWVFAMSETIKQLRTIRGFAAIF